mgnify:CR=1 FL=1
MQSERWVQEFGGFLGLRPTDLIGQERLTERDVSDYRIADRVDLPPPPTGGDPHRGRR